MKISPLHSWQLSPKEAIDLQKRLARQIVLHDSVPVPPRVIAGVDVSYARIADKFHAAVVLLDYDSMEIMETASASGDVNFPYVPGLLSFRELPILLQAFEKLETVPDVILVDGQGIAHPRRLGLASHLGLWLDLPTIGCAKSRLCGECEEPAAEKGAWTLLRDDEEPIGQVLRTKDRVRPLYISPGHRIDCRRAAEIVLKCGRGYRLPEPTRQAHLMSNRVRLQQEASRR